MRDFDLKVEFKISATGANGGIQYRSRLLMAPHKGSIENPLGTPMPPGITTFLAAVKAGLAERAPARGNAPAAPSWRIRRSDSRIRGRSAVTNSISTRTTALPVSSTKGRAVESSILPEGSCELLPGKQNRLGTVHTTPTAAVKPHNGWQGEWQQAQIIARGNTLVHVLNGQVITVTVDEVPSDRARQGILSLQLEGSGQIWYRNV